jgi:hypothetical protein
VSYGKDLRDRIPHRQKQGRPHYIESGKKEYETIVKNVILLYQVILKKDDAKMIKKAIPIFLSLMLAASVISPVCAEDSFDNASDTLMPESGRRYCSWNRRHCVWEGS